MNIAILISGRIHHYSSLLTLLNNNKDNYNIHVFMSVNDNDFEFYDKLKDDLKYFIKGINISKYEIPPNFYNIFMIKCNNIYNTAQYRTLSMLYNDNKCFNMAIDYKNKHNIQYDIYLRTRSDIICKDFPFSKYSLKSINDYLYCVNPICKFTLAITNNPDGEFINGRHHCYGDVKHHGKYVTGDIAFGNEYNMMKYCNCYEYVLQKNEEYKGNYFICFEYSITTYLEDININWVFFDFDYAYIHNRTEYEIK